jgi:hypothetical protein
VPFHSTHLNGAIADRSGSHVTNSSIIKAARAGRRIASGLRAEDQNRGIRTEAKKAGAGGDKEPGQARAQTARILTEPLPKLEQRNGR